MITVKSLIHTDTKDLKPFLEHNRGVKTVLDVNECNDAFCTAFNLFIETEHATELEYIHFKKGVQETFHPRKFIDVHVVTENSS